MSGRRTQIESAEIQHRLWLGGETNTPFMTVTISTPDAQLYPERFQRITREIKRVMNEQYDKFELLKVAKKHGMRFKAIHEGCSTCDSLRELFHEEAKK